jgi:hypothetical protein
MCTTPTFRNNIITLTIDFTGDFCGIRLIKVMMKCTTIEPAVASFRERNPKKEMAMDRESAGSNCNCRRVESKGKTSEHAEGQVPNLPMKLVPRLDLKNYGSQSVASSSTRAMYYSNSGVYFNGIETTCLGSSLHPLQMCTQPEGKLGYSESTPKGRPLCTPPSLMPFKVPNAFLGKRVAPPSSEQTRKRKFLSPTHGDTHLIPDESPSSASKSEKREGKRERIVAELHGKDSRMSSDEIMFVEAATKLAFNPGKGRSNEGSKKRHRLAILRTLNALPPPPFALPILH